MEFTKKEKTEALNYSIYMIATSYFNSCVCLNKGCEKHGHLIYMLVGVKEQYKMEDAVIALMEETLLPMLPQAFQEADVTAAFLPNGEGIGISGRGYQLKIAGWFNKKKKTTEFVCEYTNTTQKDDNFRLPERREGKKKPGNRKAA